MGLNLKILKMSPALFAWRYTERIADQTDHFADVFVRENVAYGYDVMTFESTQRTPFCLEKSSVRKSTIECFSSFFQCELSWNKVKYARITITHVCFIALTLAGSLGWCWTLGLSASCSNNILGTRQMLMHEKTCVIPIVVYRFCCMGLFYS